MSGYLCYSGRMASIQVTGTHGVVVTLTGPDDDGDYGWTCNGCLARYHVQPIADAIADAEVHVDIHHERESENGS